MNANDKKIALVTGANKGLGFEISRQLAKNGIRVIIGARDAVKGQKAADKLKQEGLDVYFHQLDVTNIESIRETISWIKQEFGTLHILVNNAGINIEYPEQVSIFDVTADTVAHTLETNFYAPLQLTQLVISLMKESGYGRIVNMSSTLGSLTDAGDPNSIFASVLSPAYRISKTALNSLTVLFARELGDTNILVNSVCPGWVKTDMGTEAAPFTVEEGADTPVWLATLPDNGPNGGYFYQRQPLLW
ncbi:MAG: SDR family oxidoreductase [Heteroscytonema crispum UTEX LB 1556]